jgi:PAS domain S-box-containing protein
MGQHADHNENQELDRLRARAATREEQQPVSPKAVLEPARQLEKTLAEEQERAEQLAQAEQSLRKQVRILHAIFRHMSAGVVVAHESGKFLLFNPEAERILGMGTTNAPPAEWSQHYGCYLPDRVTPYPSDQLPLARAIQGEEVEDTEIFVQNEHRPGGVWLCATARPLRDEVGAVRGGVVVFRDITDHKRAARRMAAQHAVTRVLAESATLDEAAPRILQAVCDSVGWDMGTLWIVDRSAQVLRCVDVWHRPEVAIADFETAIRGQTFSPGVGLPGRVWANRASAWIADVLQDDNFPRAAVAAQYDLHGAFAFPILSGNTVIGVIEFFSREIRKPDQDLLSMIGALGSQVGQFIERKRMEEELHKSRERFELAMLGSRDGIWDWDLLTNEVYYSPRWKSMLGYEEREIQNHFDEWEQRLHPDDRERALATIDAYLAGQASVYELEHRLRCKDGSYRWILARGVAFRDAHGKPYRMAGSHTDITGRKRDEEALRDSEALYHSLVETLPLNVFRKDLQGRFTFGNHLFVQTLGKPLAEIRGTTDFDYYPKELAEKYRQDDRRVIAEKAVLHDIEEHRKPDGEKIYVEVLKTPVFDSRGEVLGTQGLFWDVTDRKRAEEEMHKAKEAAESANRAKSAFLANISHEIRTPMNAVIGMTELVLETDLTIEQREYLELVKKSADSLLSVINDVLDFSKVEAGKLELDLVAFSLRDYLGDTLNSLAPRAYQKGLELACHVAPDVPEGLLGDPVRLGQIIVNLVGNALKFTEQGEVVVDVEATAWSDKEVWLHFAVTDTGVGVPADKQELIFNPFAQADSSTTRKYGGTGLGLAIAQRLVEMMGGRIWLESASGKGSTFHFTACFGVQAASAARPVPVEEAKIRGMQVLVVDDNATNRRILEETLTHWQMEPVLAASGRAALEILSQAAQAGEPFPLALIDVQMPEMDGYTLAEKIKQDPDLSGTTLLVLTSSGQPGDANRRRELGINAYLTKPIKQADLWKAIMQALGRPLTTEEPSIPQRAAAEPAVSWLQAGRRLRILLVEDNLVNQKLAVRLLEKRGHHVVVADNGLAALSLLKNQPFDVCLMDVQMPVMDGLETTAVIRAQETSGAVYTRGPGNHLPIVAMTAYAMKGDRERCLAAGMDHYISKPIRAKELFETVEGIVAGNGPGDTSETPAEDAGPPEERGSGGVFDKATALQRVAGDEELLRELAALFLQECPHLLAAVGTAVSEGQPAVLQRAAHTLKGAIDNFASPAAYEAAHRLEKLGRDGNLVDAKEACAALEKEINCLNVVLADFVQSSQFKVQGSESPALEP